MNPWITMWLKPRQTIRYLRETNPTRNVLLLAALGGIANSLGHAIDENIGAGLSLLVILPVVIVLGAIGGIISLYVGSWLLRWTGRWIGGRASTASIRTASAWSQVPLVWMLLGYIPLIALTGTDVFSNEMPVISESVFLSRFVVLFGIVSIITAVWSIVLAVISLSEVQRFSAWKAIGNMLLSGLVVFAVGLLIMIPFILIIAL